MIKNKHTRYDRKVTDFRLNCAKKLNKRPTKSELQVIEILKGFGIEYIQNYLIKRYIVDFYLPKFNMILEIDGGYHNKPKQRTKDLIRDSWFWRYGYKAYRFKNEEIDKIRQHLLNVKDDIS